MDLEEFQLAVLIFRPTPTPMMMCRETLTYQIFL